MSNNTRAFLDMAGAHLTMLFYAREVRTYSKVILKVPLMQPAVHAAAPLGKHAPYPEILLPQPVLLQYFLQLQIFTCNSVFDGSLDSIG